MKKIKKNYSMRHLKAITFPKSMLVLLMMMPALLPIGSGATKVILVAGGEDADGLLDEVEIVQLGGPDLLHCPDPPRLPRADRFLLGMADPASGAPVLCGGDANPDRRSCLVLAPDGGGGGDMEWAEAPFSLEAEHAFGASVGLADGRYWVLGGDYR